MSYYLSNILARKRKKKNEKKMLRVRVYGLSLRVDGGIIWGSENDLKHGFTFRFTTTSRDVGNRVELSEGASVAWNAGKVTVGDIAVGNVDVCIAFSVSNSVFGKDPVSVKCEIDTNLKKCDGVLVLADMQEESVLLYVIDLLIGNGRYDDAAVLMMQLDNIVHSQKKKRCQLKEAMKIVLRSTKLQYGRSIRLRLIDQWKVQCHKHRTR